MSLALALGATMSSALMMSPRAPVACPRAGPVNMYWAVYGQEAQPDQNLWYIFPRDGASSQLTGYYEMQLGQEQVLGRNDLSGGGYLRPDQDGIAEQQCAVQIAQDGSCAYLYALGQQPTGYRTGPHEQWTWLQPGESMTMQHHWKISMDVNYPDQAVYKLADGYVVAQEKANREQTGQPMQDGPALSYMQQEGFRGQQF